MRRRFAWTLLLVPILAAAIAAPFPAASVEGTVSDATTGRPLAGANVSVVGTSLGAATDADGRFVLTGVPAGTVDVRVTLVGYAPHVERGVRLNDTEASRIEVRLAAADVETVVAGDSRRSGSFGEAALPPPAPVTPGAAGRGAATGGAVMRGSSAAEAPRRSSERSADYSSDAYGDEADASRVDDGERAPRERRDRRQSAASGLLTAGDVDDGLNWNAFLRYSSRAMQQGSVLRDLRLDDRLTLRVVDTAGRPVAGARVRIDAVGQARSGDRVRGLTTEAGTDGRLALFPRYDFGQGASRLEISVTVPGGRGATETLTVDLQRLRGETTRTVRLRTRAERPRALDLAVVLDVTGSMGDEHRYLTDEFEAIVGRALRQYPDADLRFALVAYRDRGDDFVVRSWDFTRSEREMRDRLEQLSAGGGGDMPEAMDEALDAMLDLDWRTGTAARIAFLIADAPPHASRLTETLDAVREARARGLRIYPLAASGVDNSAEHVMRTAAVLTQGRYLWLTDDSGVGNSHAEPHVPCYEVSRVDDLVARVIESELAGRRIESDRQDVVRTVGNPVDGVCEPDVVSQQGNYRQDAPRRRTSPLGYD